MIMQTNFDTMKSAAAAVVLMAAAVNAQQPAPASAAPPSVPRNTDTTIGGVVKASDLMDWDVNNADGREWGEVEDLVVDLAAGRVLYALVSRDDTPGVDDAKWYVIPPVALKPAGRQAVSLTLPSDKIAGAPTAMRSQWRQDLTAARLNQIYGYYGQERLIASPPANSTDASPRPGSGIVRKATDIIGAKVTGSDNQKVGKVSDLGVSLSDGRLTHVIVSSGGILGVGDTLRAVPPGSLRYDADGESLVLALGTDAFTRAPNFEADRWPDLGNRDYGDELKGAYEGKAKSVDADNTGRNVRDRDGARLTPFDQGGSKGDLELTRNVRRAIVDDDTLSVNAQNVKIISVNGHVTLRGPVNSPAEKQAVEAFAIQIAGKENVSSELEVQSDSR